MLMNYIIGGIIVSIGLYIFYKIDKKYTKIKNLREEILWEYPITCENCRYFKKHFAFNDGTCKDGNYRRCSDTCEFFKFSADVYYEAQKQAEFRYNVKGER